jgi:hypothetical protein
MICFTVCSNNYLAEALTLGQTLKQHASKPVEFLIFLTDKYISEIDYKSLSSKVIEVTDEITPGYLEITSKYNIIELSTAIKPGVCKYLFNTYAGEDTVLYFDPDICLFNDVSLIDEEFGDSTILLTPHNLKPVPVGTQPFENVFLNFGIYNLGFIGLKRSTNAFDLLNWWEQRTMQFGIIKPEEGFFVDQLWLTLAPIYFEGIKVSYHTGLNTAYWNINERQLALENEKYVVNGTHPLVFFHFSSFDFTLKKLAKRSSYTEPTFDKSALIKGMKYYKQLLELNNYTFYHKFKPYYSVTFDNYIAREFPNGPSKGKLEQIKKMVKIMPQSFNRGLVNLGHIISKLNDFKG